MPLASDTASARAFVREDFQTAFQEAGLRRLEDFFTVVGEPLTKPGLGTRYRARLLLRRSGVPCVVYLKRFGREGFRDRLRRRLEQGMWVTAGEHEMLVATALIAAGIPVAEPLAWGWQDAPDCARRSFVVLSAAPGEPAHHWVTAIRTGTLRERWEKKKQLVRRLADLARRFHGPGWRHRDFYLNHIFVTETPGGFELSLIDLQRVFRPRWRPERWQVKDLAQLNFSASHDQFSCAMRMRFVRSYLGVRKLNSDQKQLLRSVLRKSESIGRRQRA